MLLFSVITSVFVAVLLNDGIGPANADCADGAKPSVTTTSGDVAPMGPLCSNQLIFEDNFDTFDTGKWNRDSTFSNGGNGEFQMYTDSDRNSYTKNSKLILQPTLSILDFPNLETCGTITLPNCTYDCKHNCSAEHIAPPVQSARLETRNRFAFKYGRVEIRAKMPLGEWLRTDLWMLPKDDAYGAGYMSGTMNIAESRGNEYLVFNGKNIGVYHISSLVHYGTHPNSSAYELTYSERNVKEPLSADFHLYQLEWTPTYIRFGLDNEWFSTIKTAQGFFNRGDFAGPNPWQGGDLNAPFDREFYLVMSLAVGGRAYFPEFDNESGKPWLNGASNSTRQFWEGRKQWLDTWNFDPDTEQSSTLQVDYVRVYAL